MFQVQLQQQTHPVTSMVKDMVLGEVGGKLSRLDMMMGKYMMIDIPMMLTWWVTPLQMLEVEAVPQHPLEGGVSNVRATTMLLMDIATIVDKLVCPDQRDLGGFLRAKANAIQGASQTEGTDGTPGTTGVGSPKEKKRLQMVNLACH